jgi:twitching motility protein PilT
VKRKIHQIYSAMQTGTESGMQTMNQALFDLYQRQLVSYDEIFTRTMDPKELLRMTKGSL